MRSQGNESETSACWQKVGNESGLYRYRPSGGYYARLRRGSRELRRSLRTKNLPEARRKLADLKRDLDRVDPAVYKTTLAGCADQWMLTQAHLAPATLKLKGDIVRRIARDWPGGAEVRLDRVRTGDVRQWLSSYNVSASTYNTFLETIRSILRHAVENRIIAANPADPVERRRREKPIRITPSYADFQRIVADLRAQTENGHGAGESADLVEFMGEQGLGQAEIKNLLWQHVDWDGGTLRLFRRKTRTAFTVPIMPNVRSLLERRRGWSGQDPKEHVFRHGDCKKALEGACRRLNLPRYSPRALRRLFVTRALRNGVDVKTIALWQGHVDGGQLILRTYSAEVGAAYSTEQAAKMAGGL